MVSTEGLGRAIAPDGKPADLIVEADGTTWLRVERYGVKAWANLEELRRPLVSGRVYIQTGGTKPDGPWTFLGHAVRDPGFTFGGAV